MGIFTEILGTALLVLATAGIGQAQYETMCPPDTQIAPCTCDREGVNCNKVRDIEQLRKAFQATMNPAVLRAVWIQDTPLTVLPRDVFGKYQISLFNLDSNNLTTVESGVFNSSMNIISLLSLYNNRLAQFPFDNLKGMVNLQVLNMAGNRLTAIPENAFRNLTRLIAVLLYDNRITTVGRMAFYNLPNLQRLEIFGNLITTLGASALEMNVHSPWLRVLLGNNSLSSVNASAFHGMEPYLIDLEDNRLTALPEPIFGPMVNSIVQKEGAMFLRGNPLTCHGCDYAWIAMNKFTLVNAMQDFMCINGMQMTNLTLMNIGCF